MAVADALGSLFRYRLESDTPVSQGGCGCIWKAVDLLFGDRVAIKTITERLAWREPERAARAFRKEAIAGARLGELSHNIVKIRDLGIVDETLYYAMEWLEPEPGFKTIDMSERAGRISLGTAKVVLRQICEGLETAHENGIVHSDIAPANILFDHRRHLYKLTDFGLLKIVDEWLVSRGSGSLLRGGRLDFMPPEVIRSISAVGYASDAYATAVTFRVLLEGPACLPSAGGTLVPTPGVIRIRHEQRDAPAQVRQLLARFIDGHGPTDTIAELSQMLQRIPG